MFSELGVISGGGECDSIQSPSLPELAAEYAETGRNLAQVARNAARSIKTEQELMPFMANMTLHQQQIVKAMTSIDASSDDDLIAKLEVWQAENVELEATDVSTSDKLVLSVLEALRKRT